MDLSWLSMNTFMGATWLFASPGWPLLGQPEWVDSVLCVCHMPADIRMLMAEVQQSIQKHTRSPGLHSEMTQPQKLWNKCRLNQMQNTFYTLNRKDKTNLETQGWWSGFDALRLGRESTGKSHMATWQMCSPLDLERILLGVYPKQTEKDRCTSSVMGKTGDKLNVQH